MNALASPALALAPFKATKNTSRSAGAIKPAKPARSVRVSASAVQREAAPEAIGRREAVLKAAGVVGTLSLAAAQPASAAPAIGDKAPDFKLPSTAGKDISLGELTGSGKWTVLYFYNQDFTTGCSLEATRFEQALPDFKAAKAQVVGVSMDKLDKHNEFCSKKGLTFPLLSDDTGSVSASYGADLTIPILGKFSDRQTFLIDPKGNVRSIWKERDGSMADVKSPAHATQVLSKIKELSA